ncbi:MAG: hypothetical protein ACYDBJ_22275 [Aggregatilineales bacterium]
MNHPTSEPLFMFSWRAGTPPVEEQLALYPDGAAWYWSLRPAPAQRQDRAGTFALGANPNRRDQARQLADQLWALAAPDIAPDRNNVQYRLALNYHNQQRLFMLPLGESGLEDVRDAVGQLGRALRQQAEAYPVAVINFGLKAAAPTSSGFFLTLENTGTEPVSVFLGSGHLTLVDEKGTVRWQGTLTNNTMGLTDQAGTLLDGLYAPALIQPGTVAKAFIQNAQLTSTSLNGVSAVRLEGQIQLPAPADFPLHVQPTPAQFSIQSRAS